MSAVSAVSTMSTMSTMLMLCPNRPVPHHRVRTGSNWEATLSLALLQRSKIFKACPLYKDLGVVCCPPPHPNGCSMHRNPYTRTRTTQWQGLHNWRLIPRGTTGIHGNPQDNSSYSKLFWEVTHLSFPYVNEHRLHFSCVSTFPLVNLGSCA